MSEFTHIVCPYCNGTNKLPNEALKKEPKCGRCKKAILDTTPIELTNENISQHIEKNDIPLIIDFWAPWCGPCKTMGPNFEQSSRNFKSKVRFAKVNTEAEQSLGGHFNIRSIPTLVLFKNGKELDRVSGALDANALSQWINNKI
ncbi:thioredoxin TrxC [Sulfurimonas sp. MAG313]|nr:thioredoxin TrxC [Sulfurimonas sp. MAG313]MDF1879910.1 thioredoxin TrxC [Sulfurimonas sp. MAG313]